MPETKILPAAKVPAAGYDLLSKYAEANKISISEAIRQVCQNSEELQNFAKANKLPVDFSMSEWGGNRRGGSKDDSEE